jgi:hypothetical protein
MNWSLLTGRDIAAIILAAALLGAVLIASVEFPNLFRSNGGFGPDWECTNPGHGEPICVKKNPAR